VRSRSGSAGLTILGLIEEATVSHAGLLNERILAACAAGLIAGPWVGLALGVFVTWLAVAHHGLPSGSIATSMLCGGLVGGLLYRWRPFGGNLAPQWPHFPLRSWFTRGTL
jgi:LytS/YehU family sensor histidine kinase